MSETEFWKTTPAFLHARIQAKKAEERTQAEFTRVIAFYAANAGKFKAVPNMRKFWPLPWDTVVEFTEIDINAAAPMLSAMDAAIAEQIKRQKDGTN
jgi:hypothetical protein